MHNKTVMLPRSKLNSMESEISEPLINSEIVGEKDINEEKNIAN